MIPVYEELPLDNEMQAVETEEKTSLTFRMDENNKRIIGMIDDLDAIKQTIYCILRTERYQYEMYSEDYGSELQDLVGRSVPLVFVNLQDNIQDALLADDRILAIGSFQFEEVGRGAIAVSFVAETVIGEIEIEEVMLNG